ncbi:MAG: DUF5317 family protein [Roseiflexaceae bacterium]|nr:DUF5317 family protein [Roseiflexaceae bacterium]
MILFVFYGITALVCGVAALFRSPRLPRYWLLLMAAALPQIALIGGIQDPLLTIFSAICLATWGLLNRTIIGLPIVSIGMLMNMLAMVAHGGRMPIDSAVLAGLGHTVEPGAILLGSKDVVVDGSLFLWLSDHLVIGTGKLALIASPGDVVLLIGLLCWIVFSQAAQRNDTYAQPVHHSRSKNSAPAISARR